MLHRGRGIKWFVGVTCMSDSTFVYNMKDVRYFESYFSNDWTDKVL